MSYKTEELALQIKQARKSAGISQRDLSARSGVTQSHISQIENAGLNPGVSTLIDIGRALDMELVLVPKKLMPAVKGLLQNTPSRRAHFSGRNGGTRRIIAEGERIVAEQRALYGASADLDRIMESLHFLRSSPLLPNEFEQLREAVRILSDYKMKALPPEVIKGIATTLHTLRNRISDGESDEPRPAYGFDEDDDDA